MSSAAKFHWRNQNLKMSAAKFCFGFKKKETKFEDVVCCNILVGLYWLIMTILQTNKSHYCQRHVWVIIESSIDVCHISMTDPHFSPIYQTTVNQLLFVNCLIFLNLWAIKHPLGNNHEFSPILVYYMRLKDKKLNPGHTFTNRPSHIKVIVWDIFFLFV